MPELPQQVTDAVLETYTKWAPYTAAASLDAPQDEPDPVGDLLADISARADELGARIEYFRANPVFPPSRIEQHARETAFRMLADEPEEDESDGDVRFMYADGPLIVAGERVHRHRAPESAEPVTTARCVLESDGYHVHEFEVRVLDETTNRWVFVEIVHDFRLWDEDDTEPLDPIVYGSRLGSPLQEFDSVEAAFAVLLPDVPVPAIDCNCAVPSVRDTPACDIKPGMRIQVGAAGIWQPPVSSVKTYGPSKDENPSHPHTWWTRLTLQCADGSHTTRVFSPSTPVRVVEEVGCRECKRLVPVADAVLGRRLDHSVMPPRFVEQYDLCPDCVEIGA